MGWVYIKKGPPVWSSIIAIILVWAFVYVSMCIFVQWHEQAHQSVMSECNIPTHIEYSDWGLSGQTVADYVEFKEYAECANVGNAQIESVGYVVYPILTIILVMVGACLTAAIGVGKI